VDHGRAFSHLPPPLIPGRDTIPVLLHSLGLNHTTAPVEVREKLAFVESSQPAALRQLRERYGMAEAAILSTCNRTEIYTACDGGGAGERVRRFLTEVHHLDLTDIEPCFYEFSDADVSLHLFGVSSGIDSLVIGESEILGQVRHALETAQQTGSARLLINEVFQRALKIGKRSRTETDIGRGRLSVSTAAVELAGQVFDRLEDRDVLLLGAGEMAELTAQYLVDSGIHQLVVANRTHERAVELARRFSGVAIPLDEFPSRLAEVDIVISSTSAPDFLVLPDMVRTAMRRRRGRSLFVIDIAVPRDVDPQIRQIDNVFLFDIDDLKQVVEANRKEREDEIQSVQDLIDEEQADFLRWLKALGTGPLIVELRQHADELRQQELDRWSGKLSHLSEADRSTVEAALQGYANKLLHQPLVQIRKLADSENGYLHLDTVRRLFNLDGHKNPEEAES